jgi:macrolide-specific efflux system membrane fusion protein
VVTYDVSVTLDQVPAGVKPGQTVSVSVVTGSVEDAVYVNSAAVTTAGTRHTVTVDVGGQREVRLVEIGLKGDQTTQITSGLQVGEQVAVTTATTTTGTGGFPAGGFPGGGGLGGARPPGGGAAPAGGGARGAGQ